MPRLAESTGVLAWGWQLAALEAAILAQDYSQVADCAHRLKGSSANLGVSSLQAIASELELLARQRTLEGASDLLANLPLILEQVQAFWQNHLPQ